MWYNLSEKEPRRKSYETPGTVFGCTTYSHKEQCYNATRQHHHSECCTLNGEAPRGEKPASDGTEHDFGTKIVAVTTRDRSEKGDRGGGWFENAKIRKLGDRYCLVGQMTDLRKELKQIKEVTVWIPLSEITQIAEYDTAESARKILDAYDKLKGDR